MNEKNYSSLRQVELMWKRTERFVDALEVPASQEELKTGAMNYIAKGKQLTHDRLKVIRFADRDGWPAALNFLSDLIAQTEAEAKAMRKGKKEADARSKEPHRSNWSEARHPLYSTGDSWRNQSGPSRGREDYHNHRQGNDSYRASNYAYNKRCYDCGRFGHIARDCDRR